MSCESQSTLRLYKRLLSLQRYVCLFFLNHYTQQQALAERKTFKSFSEGFRVLCKKIFKMQLLRTSQLLGKVYCAKTLRVVITCTPITIIRQQWRKDSRQQACHLANKYSQTSRSRSIRKRLRNRRNRYTDKSCL